MRNWILMLWIGMVCLGGGMLTAADNWDTADMRVKEIKITLKTGEVLRGTFSAQTDDKVWVNIMTPKGKNTQTILKNDVAKHEWVKPLDDEIKEKLEAWPAKDFENLLTYGQTVVDKGYKKLFFDHMKTRQKDLTAVDFKLYCFMLLNNDMVNDAKELIDWAKADHGDWQAEIAEVTGRLPNGRKVSTPASGPAAKDPQADLAAGQIFVTGRAPTNQEQLLFVEDAKRHLSPEPKLVKLVSAEQVSMTDPGDVLLVTFDVSWDLTNNKSGKLTKYTVVMVYTARTPRVYQFKSLSLGTWAGFPSPDRVGN